jgi:probable addiction module antidote protein
VRRLFRATINVQAISARQRYVTIAQAVGLGRESLYWAHSTEGNPEFATVLKVMLGLELKVAV